ncbi:GNAT family N-acetyltransferase [Paenibacillus sp. GCM10027627]|uniref:GNAT family N-acetyltransferase n=1 Tax=unclassified Paenibacillus TaxID=185978 RepID=UPI003641B6EE
MEMHIVEDFTEEAKLAVRNGLIAFNRRHFPAELNDRYREVQFILKDDTGKVAGGLLGEVCRNWMEVHILYLEEETRGSGYGSELMEKAEQIAREWNCDFIKVDTLSFQALDFYQKLGFSVYGSIENVGGFTHYYLKKDLV